MEWWFIRLCCHQIVFIEKWPAFIIELLIQISVKTWHAEMNQICERWLMECQSTSQPAGSNSVQLEWRMYSFRGKVGNLIQYTQSVLLLGIVLTSPWQWINHVLWKRTQNLLSSPAALNSTQLRLTWGPVWKNRLCASLRVVSPCHAPARHHLQGDGRESSAKIATVKVTHSRPPC